MQKHERCPYTVDMFTSMDCPQIVDDVCYDKTPSLDKPNLLICLTGYFACASEGVRRMNAIQTKSAGLKILVTQSWTNEVDMLIVGAKAKKVSRKIKKAFANNTPIVKEQEFLQTVNFALLSKGINFQKRE